MAHSNLLHRDYTVAWICALPLEMTAAKAMLDNVHQQLPQPATDPNAYTLGSINGHNVAIACLPSGVYGVTSAATVIANMLSTFPSLRFGLMVGIGGGVPGKHADIRLGDVVVSSSVVQYDCGKTLTNGRFQRTGVLNKPPTSLLTVVSQLRSNSLRGGLPIQQITRTALEQLDQFARPTNDWLFDLTYDHPDGSPDCSLCDVTQLVTRERRTTEEPFVHYGLIASGNQVMKDARTRDSIAQESGIICFEMEAAGLMDQLACLVIRGICDYCDSHKHKEWQGYAALTAASYARTLLREVPKVIPQSYPEIEQVSHENGSYYKALLRSLPFEHIEERYNTIKPAHPATCKWLLINQHYQSWLDEKHPHHKGLLWLKGKPGAGKSTIVKFAFSEARQSKREDIRVAFFFNARGHELEKKALGMYRSLLYQLLAINPCAEVFRDFGVFELPQPPSYSWTIPQLQDIICQAVRRVGGRRIWIFVDALDECAEDEIRDVIGFFNLLMDQATIRVFFASRHYPRITTQKKIELLLEDIEEHSDDIRHYIESELRTENDRQRSAIQNIRADVFQRAKGIFIWVVLVVRLLNKAYDHGQMIGLERKLHQLPDDLSTLFKDMLTRDGGNINATRIILQWMLFAKRPLGQEQLYFAVLSGTDPEDVGSLDPHNITPEIMAAFIVSCSKGLAEIVPSASTTTVQFIHETIRDFLLKEGGMQYLQGTSPYSLLGSAHNSLRKCCLNYVISTHEILLDGYSTADLHDLQDPNEFAPLKKGPIRDEGHGSRGRELRLRLPFFEYALTHVFYHSNAARSNNIPQKWFLRGFRMGDWMYLAYIISRLKYFRVHSWALGSVGIDIGMGFEDMSDYYPWLSTATTLPRLDGRMQLGNG
ncbi:hypothetical protein BDW59DRAFT_153445 [Aspergillus cavernicola]|uniref:Nucleoside phosphorylase domain-containing protein n=1 Tax=Aspergillus cavernicola TaxID=176166 RepID=A0ABR4HM12_9EURO